MSKKKIAFICVHNSCRSQIAEALGKHLASDVFESYSAGTEIKSSINQDAANMHQEMAELLGITLKQVMDFVMTMMVYTQGIGTLIASGIVKDTKENMYRMLHNTGMIYLKGLGVKDSTLCDLS